MTWEAGEEALTRTFRIALREAGYPDSDECPMPADHTGDQELWLAFYDDKVKLMKSETE